MNRYKFYPANLMNCFTPQNFDERQLEVSLMDGLSVRVRQSQETAMEIDRLQRRKFLDKEFLPTNLNAGVQESRQVEWLPLSALARASGYQQPCYSLMNADLHTPDSGSRNPDIKDALYYLAFAKSKCLEELLAKPFDTQGAYSFNLFRQGLIVRMLIDELVPTVNGSPIYTPPYCERLYPALVEKALAKACGGYSNIPQKVPEVLQMLSCFPKRVRSAPREDSQDPFIQELFKALCGRSLVLFRTKDVEKLGGYGLERNVYYLLAGITKAVLDEEVVLCEIIQPKTRKVDWNGKYSLRDSIWKKYKQLRRTAPGTMISSSDLFKVADEFVVLANTFNLNQNWIEAIRSQSRHATYFQLEVAGNKPSEVVLYVSLLNSICRTSMLLASITEQAYSLTCGRMEEWSLTNCLSTVLSPGRYLLFIKTEWVNSELSGSFNLFYGFSQATTIRMSSKLHHRDFLSLLFTQHALKQNTHYLQLVRRHPLVFVSLRMLYEQTGYAYIKVYVAGDATNSLMIEFDYERFKEKGFLLKKPYNKLRGPQTLVLAPGDTTILLCKVVCNNPHEKMLFPPDSLRIYEL